VLEPADSQTSERALIALAQAGDDGAFDEIVRRRQGAVRGLLRRLSGDTALGDDLAQDTFLRAWRTMGQLRDRGAFGSWIRQIAVTVWLQHARRARVPMEFVEGHEVDRASDTDTARAYAHRLDLDDALGRLRPPERLCVVLSYAEGLSHSEIASATGLPLGTVKSHLSRGTARLRVWLSADTVSEPRTAS